MVLFRLTGIAQHHTISDTISTIFLLCFSLVCPLEHFLLGFLDGGEMTVVGIHNDTRTLLWDEKHGCRERGWTIWMSLMIMPNLVVVVVAQEREPGIGKWILVVKTKVGQWLPKSTIFKTAISASHACSDHLCWPNVDGEGGAYISQLPTDI